MQPDTAGTAPVFRREFHAERHAEAQLPYRSKAERAAESWMTLPQTVAHVRSVENLAKEDEARLEVLKALRDNAFYSRRRSFIRWKDEFRISGEPPNEIGPHDNPPQGEQWAEANIRWNTGEVLDPYGTAENGKWLATWRVVWLARSKVTELWHSSPSPNAPREPGSCAANVVSFKGRKTGPKTDKLQSIMDAMKTDIAATRLTIEQLEAMPDKELISQYGDKFQSGRTTCREARDLVVTEFDGV